MLDLGEIGPANLMLYMEIPGNKKQGENKNIYPNKS